MNPGFRVTITAQMRHGLLWEARKKLGSTKAVAKALGIHYHTCCKWMNLRGKPNPGQYGQRWARIQQKLIELTGELPEQLFPSVVSEDFLSLPKSIELSKEVPLGALQNGMVGFLTLSGPDEVLETKELMAAIRESLGMLKPREAEVLRLRYGITGAEPMVLKEIADRFDVTTERIRQIETNALRKLRHPSRCHRIKEAMGVESLEKYP